MYSYLSRIACAFLVLGMALAAPAIEPKYLPPNAEMALTLNLKQILNSELLQDKKVLVDSAKAFVQGKLDETPFKGYFDKAGFDLFRDLHSVTITTDGSKDLDSLFIAVEGNFNTEKWVDLAKSAARDSGDVLKVTKNDNVNIFELTLRANDKTIFAGLIGDSILVAAPTRAALNATIARVQSNNATLKPGVKKLI